MAGPTIQFPGYIADESVAALLSEARGFICAAEEDFGIAIVEAQAAGCPVIAYGQGGALDTVIDGVTGLLFDEQSVPCVIETMTKFQSLSGTFDTDKMTENARRFSKEQFMREFLAFVGSTDSSI
jgi:glycosyltransferase involved in cell wall biosynthesis